MTTGAARWFFIVGCQRSGTTLMRLILESHPDIRCLDESRSYAVMAGTASVDEDHRLLGLKIPCLTEQLARPSLWDPRLMPEVPNWYQRQKLIFMVRDVRDTVASMLGLRVNARSWVDTHVTPVLRAKVERDAVFRGRYADVLESLRVARYPRLARAAFYWRYKVEALFDYLDRAFPVQMVKYEDLVSRPEPELARICGFLQVPWHSSLLRHHEHAHDDLDEAGSAVGGTSARRAIDTQSLGRAAGAFNEEETAEILRFGGEAHDRLYGPAARTPTDVAS